MENKLNITHTLEKVQEGFVSRSVTNDKVTAFGSTEKEAADNLMRSASEYLQIYPEQHAEIYNNLA